MIEVIAKKSYGVTIYTDYNFIMDDKDTEFELEPGEQLVKMPAVELLKLYEKENEVF